MADLFVGTSGWSYLPWRGRFYPEKLPPREMLGFYAGTFRAVEMNNSFYRLPAPGAMLTWHDAVPDGFRFAVKAPGEITHRRRLDGTEAATIRLVERAAAMGSRRGPILFQLPPFLKADLNLLDDFLRFARPMTGQTVFEFRHSSWFTDAVYDLLRSYDVALCLTQSDAETQPLKPAAGFAYLRLRKADYSDDELRAWRDRLNPLLAEGRDVYCFFKHEDEAKGPAYALRFLELQEAS
ncbi:MAG: DUF72 domain-containing protein [Chloroflexota bacterium]